jgi:hypothetical protein
MLHIDVGLGGGTGGFTGRAASGVDLHLSRDWGLGAALTGSLAGVLVPGVHGTFGLEPALPKGWLRLRAGAGPAILGYTGNNCDQPLCGYVAPAPVGIGALGSLEVAYWVQNRSSEPVGATVRAQVDSRLGVEITANLSFGADLLALARHR